MARKTAETGFALMLVLILVAVGVILGTTYLSSASLRTHVAHNYKSLSRARYLAESGLQHGLYILRFSPEELQNTAEEPLGPFHVDETSDGYFISAAQDSEDHRRYILTAMAHVGEARRTCSASVYRLASPTTSLKHGVLVGSGFVWTPSGLRINGDVHVNGQLFNFAVIDGNVSATNGAQDLVGGVTGALDGAAEPVTPPIIGPLQYVNYSLGGTNYQAAEFTQEILTSENPLANGGAVTSGNVAGVVHLVPATGNTVTLGPNLNFTGTLVIQGHVRLDGANITLNAADGFPAIVATGQLQVTGNARNVEINGVVVAKQGIAPAGDTTQASTRINGALFSDMTGYASGLLGAHELTYQQRRASLFDLSLDPTERVPRVRILVWND